MPVKKQTLDPTAFNQGANLPFSLRLKDFDAAMQDVYDFFYDVNKLLLGKGLHRMDDMLRPAAMSGMLSDMLTASMAKHSRCSSRTSTSMGIPISSSRAVRQQLDRVRYRRRRIKSTRKKGGAVDTHGGRDQWMCVFVYTTDHTTEPAQNREPMKSLKSISGRSKFRVSE